MSLALFKVTSEQVTFAFWLAIAAFAVCLLIKRLQRIGAPEARPSLYVAELPRDFSPGASDEPITIAWFKLPEEAEMWAAILRAEGIEASVLNTTDLGNSGPQIMVRAVHAQRAIEILREAEAKEHTVDDQERDE